eukprot:m.38278 g.38278  ORF g.38278 m.38278 type:complete len:846 (-) comp9415_c0_seq1:230-2767(-)
MPGNNEMFSCVLDCLLVCALVTVLSKADSQSQEFSSEDSLLTILSPNHKTLSLPQQGLNICDILRSHCGKDHAGAQCVKDAFTRIISNETVLTTVRSSMEIPLEFYFLCAAHFVTIVEDVANNSVRVEQLTSLFRNTLPQECSNDKDDNCEQDSKLSEFRAQYIADAKYSTLQQTHWNVAEKLAHYLTVLGEAPDELHLIDRLAVTLCEARLDVELELQKFATSSNTTKEAATHIGFLRSRHTALVGAHSLLLHFYVLRGKFVHPLQRPMHLVRNLSGRYFWDLNGKDGQSTFPWTSVLLQKHNMAALRRDLQRGLSILRTKGLSSAQQEGIHSGSWDETHLIVEGQAVSQMESLFSSTFRILRQSGGEFINARISTLRRGTHISAHCGISNAKLRAHVGISVPFTDGLRSGIRVGDTFKLWEEGAILLFDDSFEHEVWWQWNENKSNGNSAESSDRVVLILDIFHPDLRHQDVVKIRQSFGKTTGKSQGVLGDFTIGQQLRLTRYTQHEFGNEVTLVGVSKNDNNKLSVKAKNGYVDVYPDEVVSEDDWNLVLTNGYKRGDSVCKIDSDGCETGTMLVLDKGGDKGGDKHTLLTLVLKSNITIEVAPIELRRAGPYGTKPEIDTVESMSTNFTVQLLHDSSVKIFIVDNFLTSDEISTLISLGTPMLENSHLQSSKTGFSEHHYRSSKSAYISGVHALHPTIIRVQKRVSLFTGKSWRNSESIQFVRYEAGQFFKNHTDYFKPTDRGYDMQAGQRLYTALLYLNDRFEGGSTTFPLLSNPNTSKMGLTVMPKAGRMLFWRNVDSDGNPIPYTLHSGDVVNSGTKLVCNLWVLEKPFDMYRTLND